MDDTLAARMRAAYVGEDAIAFDELKPEVRARWERVAAVACPAPTMTMEESQEDFNQFAERHNAGLRGGVPFTAPIRVPFSDQVINKMAREAWCIVNSWAYQQWNNSNVHTHDLWRSAIRAALAAGGLEPCAVPVDSEHELWKRIEPGLGEHIEPLVDAYLRGHMEVTGQKESSISYSRVGLSYVRDAVIGSLIVAAPERASDEELAEIVWNTDRAEFNRLHGGADIRTVGWNEADDADHLAMFYAVRAVRARVEAPLLAEIQRLDIENRDRAFYVEQFAAVSQERDAIKARVAELEKYREGRQRDMETVRGYMETNATLRAELEAIRELCNDDDATGALNSVTRLRDRHDVFDRMTTEMEELIAGLVAELAAHAVLDVPAGVPSVEELKHIYIDTKNKVNTSWNTASGFDEAIIAIRDAVLRGMGAAGVDPDAWKTPLRIECSTTEGDYVQLDSSKPEYANFVAKDSESRSLVSISPADAARAAQWLASYAAAHGCQVGPLAIEPIASPDVLEQLVVIGWKARSDAAFCEGGTIDAGNLAQVAAILRAAQAYVDVTPDEVIKVWNEHLNDEVDPAKVVLALLDSRIRYRVSPPETPNAQMQRCIDRKNRHIDALKAIVKKWKAKGTETPQGLPTREELAWAINAAWRKHCKYPPNPLGTAIPEEWDAQADAALEFLRPWLHEPTGWELDVTARELESLASQYESWEDAQQAILDLCRSRIRPTFECKECAKWRTAYEQTKTTWIDRANAARAALEGE